MIFSLLPSYVVYGFLSLAKRAVDMTGRALTNLQKVPYYDSMQEYFTTGELSQLFHINVQTLHYYDSIGLLTPHVRDTHGGRRLYSFDQVYKLTTIRYQQKLGKSLKQIAAYMESTDMATILDDLKVQRDVVQRKMEELRTVGQTIEEKVTFIERKFAEMHTTDIDSVAYETFDERPYIPADGDEFQFGNDFFYVYPTVVFHERGRKSFGVFVPDDFHEKHPLSQLARIPAGTYLCGYHLGTYETIFGTIDRLKEVGRAEGHQVSEQTVCFNIIDQFVEPDSTKYLTELQIRVVDR